MQWDSSFVRFLRFTEIENGLLLAKIGPKNNIITFLAAHFEDRFPLENFAIYDETRELFAVHPAGKQFIIVTGEKIDENVFNHISREEELYQELFKTFWKCIAIQGRKNQKLQTQMLPLRFRDYMMEFRWRFGIIIFITYQKIYNSNNDGFHTDFHKFLNWRMTVYKFIYIVYTKMKD